jgi:hypothetical protein
VSTPPVPDLQGQHRLDTQAAGSEPVLISHTVTTLLYALAGAGWFVIPNSTIDAVGTIVVVLLGLGSAFAARARVSPAGRITWTGIQGTIRALVYEEVDRLIAAAPALTAASVADQIADAVDAAHKAGFIAGASATPPQQAPASSPREDPPTDAIPVQTPPEPPTGTARFPAVRPAQ